MAPSRGPAGAGAAALQLLPLALSCCAAGVAAFHDDDCELAAGRKDAVVDWPKLRDHLAKGEREEAARFVAQAKAQLDASKAQCELGVAAVCLFDATPAEAKACTRTLPVVRILASRWPIFLMLADLQGKVGRTELSCDDLSHPSINWTDWREKSKAFVEKVPPWLNGMVENDTVPEAYNEAVADAQGVIWKASSAAVAHGRTIADWTNQCAFGVLSAQAIRASGMILSNGDVYRIVERAIESSEAALRYVAEALRTSWPLFGVLHVLSLMKLALHDTHLHPGDLAALREPAEGSNRSALWKTTAASMRSGAARGRGMLLLTVLPQHRVNFLMNFFKHADRLGFLQSVVVAPARANLTGACASIAALFAGRHPDRVPLDWAPCLPFVSMFAQRAQYLLLHVALQLGLPVLWFDFHVVWFKNPLDWLEGAAKGVPNALPYEQPCPRRCGTMAQPEVFLADEFYQRFWPRNAVFFLRPTDAVRQWLESLARWLCSYPYADVARGLHYFAHPDEPDAVPSISMLPAAANVPRVAIGALNVEQDIVGYDGWFGNVEDVVALEIGGFIQESDRVTLLDRLLMGTMQEARKFLLQARKNLSPLRPTQRLYQRFVDGNLAPAPCQWEQVPNAYIGGYAAGVDAVFSDTDEAKCECLRLGVECRGITCEKVVVVEGSPDVVCTVRHGDPPLAASPTGEHSLVKVCPDGGCDAPPILRIVHVNFADGCCEAEQNQSATTARQFGADESRPLRGDFLDEDFKRRNHHLLTFNRTPELTQHKTPSGKIGYYVWKPYVVLRTLQDPALPWDTTVVVWTDAGIYFVSDMRPLVQKYMRFTDVSATRTPMMEGDFSKRDAFILLDADYKTIMETNQVATGVIVVRKTQLAIEFLERWLRACEEPRIMTEEPSVLGSPDYFTYKNNNDDQTAFSLLFKKHGFEPFSVGERDAVVYTGRNLAKFVKASDDFALGVRSDRDAYLRAADEAAKQPRAAASMASPADHMG